jgi:hypothetical protein
MATRTVLRKFATLPAASRLQVNELFLVGDSLYIKDVNNKITELIDFSAS